MSLIGPGPAAATLPRSPPGRPPGDPGPDGTFASSTVLPSASVATADVPATDTSVPTGIRIVVVLSFAAGCGAPLRNASATHDGACRAWQGRRRQTGNLPDPTGVGLVRRPVTASPCEGTAAARASPLAG